MQHDDLIDMFPVSGSLCRSVLAITPIAVILDTTIAMIDKGSIQLLYCRTRNKQNKFVEKCTLLRFETEPKDSIPLDLFSFHYCVHFATSQQKTKPIGIIHHLFLLYLSSDAHVL